MKKEPVPYYYPFPLELDETSLNREDGRISETRSNFPFDELQK
jgi:hypothetical protein